MRLRSILTAGLLMASTVAGSAFAGVQTFELDDNHTILGFKASTLLFDVPGRFDKYKVEISGDPETGADARVRLELFTRSINTENSKRDDHLRTPDFFDANQYPKIIFTSSKVSKAGDKVTVDGTLKMHGVEKPMAITFTEVIAKNGAGVMEHVYKATVPLNRKDFGIGADSVAAKISLNDEVQLNLLLAGFFNEPKAAPPVAKAAGKAADKAPVKAPARAPAKAPAPAPAPDATKTTK